MSPATLGSPHVFREMTGYSQALRELFQLVSIIDSVGRESDDHENSIHAECSGKLLDEDEDLLPEKVQDSNTQICTETDVTLPSYLMSSIVTCTEQSTESSPGEIKKKRSRRKAMLRDQDFLSSRVNRIYGEFVLIHQKLQQESLAQQEFALQLKKREQFISEKEALLFRHQAALAKIKGVEEEVHEKMRIINEQHESEVKQLSEALKEKVKENKRLKTSFDTLKDLNDNMKKQLNEVSEQNKMLEVQAKRVQARLENLQRKHTFLTIQKCKDSASHTPLAVKPIKVEKPLPPSKTTKVPPNVNVYELVTLLMDWISDQNLRSLRPEENKDVERFIDLQSTPKNHVQEKCILVLPIVAEQLQWLPLVNSQLHMPLIKFIYWVIRNLESGSQQTPMMSTMRRLGEDLFKGAVTHVPQDSLPESATESRTKSAPFFKSLSLPLRLVSTLIVLRTVTQVDYLAQAFDSLCMDLKTDEGKILFLDYDSVPIVMRHFKPSNKGLLSSTLDVLLQMTTESRFIKPFLGACSNESFFRLCAALLRHPKVDGQILEKLSILLQKLSKIKSNKKLFEVHGIHLLLQEMQRTASRDQVFLIINLNSILFNLGCIKTTSLTSSQ